MLRPNRAAQAIERNHQGLWNLLAEHVPWGRSERSNGVTVTSFSFPHRMFNFASMADIEEGQVDEAITAAKRFFRERHVPWIWMAGPSTRPDDLPDHLASAGFARAHDTPGMAIDLRGYDGPGSVEVREASDDEGLREWLCGFTQAFAMPFDMTALFTSFHRSAGWRCVPLRYFFAVEGNRPVATSMVFFGAGVAGIYNVGTAPDFRKRGHGERVTRACISAAIEEGYDVAVLQSSRMGLSLYEKLGFKEYCRFSFFSPPPS